MSKLADLRGALAALRGPPSAHTYLSKNFQKNILLILFKFDPGQAGEAAL
jgi:hypothetical protein